MKSLYLSFLSWIQTENGQQRGPRFLVTDDSSIALLFCFLPSLSSAGLASDLSGLRRKQRKNKGSGHKRDYLTSIPGSWAWDSRVKENPKFHFTKHFFCALVLWGSHLQVPWVLPLSALSDARDAPQAPAPTVLKFPLRDPSWLTSKMSLMHSLCLKNP